MTKKKKGRIGPSFDDFLKEDGIYEEVTARAIKRVIARQLDALMQEQGISKRVAVKFDTKGHAVVHAPGAPRQVESAAA